MMVDLPYMMMNWARFFSDSKVDMLSSEEQGVYAILLGRMWLNQGWLSADDKVIARTLRLDIRRWRSVYKPAIAPLLRREIDRDVGPIYTQKHLTEVRQSSLAISEQNVARTAKARAAIAAKRGHRPSVTELRRAPATRPATETVTNTVTTRLTETKEQPQEKEALLPNSRELLSLTPTVDHAALPPMPNGHDDEPQGDPELVQRLVKAGLKRDRPTGLMAALWQEVEDDDGQADED